MGTFSRIMHHFTKLKSSQADSLSMTTGQLCSSGLYSFTVSFDINCIVIFGACQMHKHKHIQSPVLNPTEHLWDVVEREICIEDVLPRNLHLFSEVSLMKWPLSVCERTNK
ncbi:hypothetical protein AMECASPLE_028065 [Ameca splendens]|uniref:Uncharacterized protein n=1 Tax=Ameca splendens TaxID=208324 RepID=A0ABV0Z480_9TELE